MEVKNGPERMTSFLYKQAVPSTYYSRVFNVAENLAAKRAEISPTSE